MYNYRVKVSQKWYVYATGSQEYHKSCMSLPDYSFYTKVQQVCCGFKTFKHLKKRSFNYCNNDVYLIFYQSVPHFLSLVLYHKFTEYMEVPQNDSKIFKHFVKGFCPKCVCYCGLLWLRFECSLTQFASTIFRTHMCISSMCS